MSEEKIIGMHQPNYIPWIGYFYKIAESNVFVFTDDSKFSTSGMNNYTYIKTQHGLFRLKIPVEYNHGSNALINQVKTKDELNWKSEHLKTIEHNYKRTRYFDEVFNDLSNLLLKNYPNLAIMNQEIIRFFCKKLGINAEYITSSSLKIDSKKEQKIIDTCKFLGGSIYVSGLGAKAYQNEENFTKRGLKLKYSDFKPFEYFQQWGEFKVNVSILDYLLEYGYDWLNVIENQNR